MKGQGTRAYLELVDGAVEDHLVHDVDMGFEVGDLLAQPRVLFLQFQRFAFEFKDQLAGRRAVGFLDGPENLLADVDRIHASILSPDSLKIVFVSDELKKTIRIRRDAKVGTDERGNTVWTRPVESTELELVSTVMLKKIIDSDDEARKQRLRRLAEERDGVLVQDTQTDALEIISDEELEAALAAGAQTSDVTHQADVVYEPASPSDDGDELSLVSTQALRRILKDEDASSEGSEGIDIEDDGGGFDPYDRS